MPDPQSSIPPALRDRLEAAADRHAELTARLSDPASLADHRTVRDLSIERAALDSIVHRYTDLRALERELAELREAVTLGADAELISLAREEIPELESRIASLAEVVLAELVTADDDAVGSAILELRAGVGGDEAAIWAGDLLGMYEKFASRRGWTFEPLDISPGDAGGVRHAIVTVAGAGAFADLAFEAGTHCVKRVPTTETQGRIHTSTATVAVLPEPTDVQIDINPADVEEHVTTAQGPGGQNVNKVATAVHLRHTPTGVEVRMQETKSQKQNREKAWRLLRARVYEIEREKQTAARAETRSAQIGSAGRAERVRTYRYKDNIAVDHRLGDSFNLGRALDGELDMIATAMRRREIADRLAALR